MGNSDSRIINEDPTKDAKLIFTQNQYEVYQAPSGKQFQKYHLQSTQTIGLESEYQHRLRNKAQDLVDLLYYDQQSNAFNCSDNNQMEVVTERIPMRFSEMDNLNLEDSTSILGTALRGFGIIHHFQGALQVREAMIGINCNNRVKVWLNSNFSLNQCEELPLSLQSLPSQQQEAEIVSNIFSLINSKARANRQWNHLMQIKQSNPKMHFQEAVQLIEGFAEQNNISIGAFYGSRPKDGQPNKRPDGRQNPKKVYQPQSNLSMNPQFSKQQWQQNHLKNRNQQNQFNYKQSTYNYSQHWQQPILYTKKQPTFSPDQFHKQKQESKYTEKIQQQQYRTQFQHHQKQLPQQKIQYLQQPKFYKQHQNQQHQQQHQNHKQHQYPQQQKHPQHQSILNQTQFHQPKQTILSQAQLHEQNYLKSAHKQPNFSSPAGTQKQIQRAVATNFQPYAMPNPILGSIKKPQSEVKPQNQRFESMQKATHVPSQLIRQESGEGESAIWNILKSKKDPISSEKRHGEEGTLLHPGQHSEMQPRKSPQFGTSPVKEFLFGSNNISQRPPPTKVFSKELIQRNYPLQQRNNAGVNNPFDLLLPNNRTIVPPSSIKYMPQLTQNQQPQHPLHLRPSNIQWQPTQPVNTPMQPTLVIQQSQGNEQKKLMISNGQMKSGEGFGKDQDQTQVLSKPTIVNFSQGGQKFQSIHSQSFKSEVVQQSSKNSQISPQNTVDNVVQQPNAQMPTQKKTLEASKEELKQQMPQDSEKQEMAQSIEMRKIRQEERKPKWESMSALLKSKGSGDLLGSGGSVLSYQELRRIINPNA